MKLTRTLFASVLLSQCLPLFAAVPTVSSATLNGSGALTITGTNFDAKPTAAPLHWQPFSALSQGSTPTQAGFLDVGGPGGGGSTYVDANAFAPGFGALRHDTGPGTMDGTVSESFPHIVNLLPANSLKVHRAFWFKAVRTVSAAPQHLSSIHIKSMRSGVTDPSDNTPYYSANPKQSTSLYLDDTTREFSGVYSCWWDTTSGSDGEAHTEWSEVLPTWNIDGWNFYEVSQSFNSVGQANGTLRVRINGTLVINRADTQPRLLSNDYLEYAQLLPGIDFAAGDQWALSYAQSYTDNSDARVVLTDNPVYASSTKFAMQIPTAWTGTSVTVTPNTVGFTPGSIAYLHVFNSSAESNSTGFAFQIPSVSCTP